MSFNTRLSYDDCAYKTNLKQSVGSATYQLGAPLPNCTPCFINDPSIRMSNSVRNSQGVSVSTHMPIIDVDSELKLLTRKASDCPTKKYSPGSPIDLTHVPQCTESIPREDTRLSNPTCTLRCTGWNRWEWLCKNPQEKALVPFDFNINNRTVVKDNHRPCIPNPINQVSALPPLNGNDSMYTYEHSGILNTDIQSTTWRTCKTYANYNRV